MSRRICWWVLWAGAAGFCRPETIPLTRGTTLAGNAIELPKDLGADSSVLIIGFSEKSAESSAEWALVALKAFKSGRTQPCCYEIPILAGLPRLFRGLILRSMKKDVPIQQQRLFLPTFDKEREWKQVTRFSEPDDPYVLVVRPTGEIIWRTHGRLSQSRLAALKKQMEDAGL